MKKTLLLFLFFILVTSGCGQKAKANYEKNYQFPNISMGASKEQVLEVLNKHSDFKNLSEDDNTILIENYPFFEITAKKVQFDFHNEKLDSIRIRFSNSSNDKLKNTILSTYGKPVKSFRRALFQYMIVPKAITVPEILDKEIVVENQNEVWHPEKSLSEMWTQDEKETFKNVWSERLAKSEKKLREEPEHWQTFFENSWESYFVIFWSDNAYTDSELKYEYILKE